MATWTTPRTWVPGEFVTALMLNTHVRDNETHLYDNLGGGSKDVCNFRLSLQTGVAVPTTDQADKTTLYVTPCDGNEIGLYDGSAWDQYTSAEMSVAAAGLTAGKPYDFFCYLNSGTPAIEALVWTNDTTLATARALQDGIVVKSGAATRRFLGSAYVDSGGKFQSTDLIRYVSNYYNRRPLRLARHDTTASWSTSTSWRQTNASTANVVKVFNCYDAWMELVAMLNGAMSQAATYGLATAIGEGSTTAPMSEGVMVNAVAAGDHASLSVGIPAHHHVGKVLALGRQDYNWLDYGSASITVYGAQTGTYWKARSGMVGYVMG